MNLVTVEDFLISFSQLSRFVVPVLSFFLSLNSGFSLTFFNVVRKHENFVCIVELQHKYFFCSFPYWVDSFLAFHGGIYFIFVGSACFRPFIRLVLFAHCLSVASVDSNALFHTACVYTLVSSWVSVGCSLCCFAGEFVVWGYREFFMCLAELWYLFNSTFASEQWKNELIALDLQS